MITKILDRDTNEAYGYIEFHNTTYSKFQNCIWNIICELSLKKDRWDIYDIIEELPIEWDCTYQAYPKNVQVKLEKEE